MNKQKKNSQFVWGFTTTELLVGIGLFTVISTIMTGIFVSVMRNQRYIQQIMTVNNNSGLVLEQIMRETRTGYNFTVQQTGACAEGWGSELSFINGQNNTETIYKLETNETVTRTEGGGEPLEMTASNVAVRNLCFSAVKMDEDLCNPERLTIILDVSPKTISSTTIPTHMQTTVSSRVLPREIVGNPFNCKK